MATWTTLAAFTTQVNSLLTGVLTSDLPTADRYLAVREAIEEYNRLEPKNEAVEFAGDGGAYYLLYGSAVDVSESNRDAGIDLASEGADSKLAVSFELDRKMLIHEIGLYLKRTGTEADKTITFELYTDDGTGLPGELIETADTIGFTDAQGPQKGRFTKVWAAIASPAELPAGTYHVVISSDYTYVDGTTEITLGVQQGDSPTNTVSTYDDGTSTWSEYGVDSAGIVEIIASTPGWRSPTGEPEKVEYPAADIDSDEQQQILEHEDWETVFAETGYLLHFIAHRPAETETIRLKIKSPYIWVEGDSPRIDTPSHRFTAISFLSAAYCCDRLANLYGQNRSSTLAADSVDYSSQSDFYKGQAKRWRALFEQALGLNKDEKGAAAAYVGDIDLMPSHSLDFLFHTRKTR